MNTYKERAHVSQRQLSETKDELKTVKNSKSSLQCRLSKLEVNIQRTKGKIKHFDMSTQCDEPMSVVDKSVTCLEMKEIYCQVNKF